MIPVLYGKDETSFDNNGLGGLPHALSCEVTRKANTIGEYYLKMKYPVAGLHFGAIQEERIIRATPAPGKAPQPFRISRIDRSGKIAEIYAPHVSARLANIITHGAFAVTSGDAAFVQFARVAQQSGQPVPFRFYTDITTAQKYISFEEPTTLSSIIAGAKGSILDTFGGELEFDGWDVRLMRQIGRDTGHEIRTGANITAVRAVTDDSGLVTAVLPFYKGTQDGQDVYVYGALCRSGTAGNYHHLRCVPLDVSGDFSGLEEGTLPTAAQVTARGQAFVYSSSASVLRTSYEISYIPTPPDLSGITPAPKRSLDLYDRAPVVLPEYGIRGPAKVVQTVHNVLLDRYNSVTVGTIQRNAADTIAAIIKQTNTQRVLW